MAKRAVIFGLGSFAEVAHFYLTHDSPYELVGFTVHRSHQDRPEFLGLPVVPFEELQRRFPTSEVELYIAVGSNRIRASIYQEAKQKGYTLLTYVSSKCTHWGDTRIGDNCFIFEQNTLQPFVTIGNDVVLWSGNHIGHHATIGDNCFISSHVVISGHVRIGPHCFIGVNATIRDNVQIGASCTIGAGALVMRTIQDGTTYVGRPAARLARRQEAKDDAGIH